tara:strand:- start:10 stop:1029 length:1020 start_codon:yes stop_codon:yes gene_type:complete
MILSLIVILLSIIFLFFFKNISVSINLFDLPDGVRKFQKDKVSCIGGIYFYFLFIVILIYSYCIDFNLAKIYELILIQNFKGLFLFLFVITFLFLIGLYDDKYELKSTNKTILLIIFIFIYVFHEESYQIKELRSSYFDQSLLLGNFSIFFTIICIFSLLVAFNMFDGSNGQSFFNFLAIFIFLFHKGLFANISSLFIFMLLIFALLNFRNKVFLGDNGVYFLSFLVSHLIILNYNNDKSINAEEIVIILLIPVLDMIRLFVTRTYRGKNPFMPDTTHIHHLIQKKYKQLKLPYFFIFLIILPLSILLFTNVNSYLIIFFQIFVYSYLVLSAKKIKINE